MTQQTTLTYGEKAVGITFNPGANPDVENIKYRFAQVIDTLHERCEATDDAELKAMLTTAITSAQTAQMWAVKAITWPYARLTEQNKD